MLIKNNFWKALLGVFAEVLVAKQVDYAGTGASAVGAGTGGTTAGSFADFQANAVEGEIGIFYSDTLLLVSGTAVGSPLATPAATAGREIFAAMKRDGNIEVTQGFIPSSYKATRTVYAAGVAQVNTAAFTGTPVVGAEYSVKVLETTPGYQPLPSWTYSVVNKSGESLATMLARLVVIINDANNIINKNTDPIVTASLGGTTITLTAKTVGTSFTLGFSNPAIVDLAAVSTKTVGPTYGSGGYEAIAELEAESDVLKGVTTNYPAAGTVPTDYGKPTAFALSTGQYTVYILTGNRFEDSPTPVERHTQKHNIILAIPSNGAANADSEVKGILGF